MLLLNSETSTSVPSTEMRPVSGALPEGPEVRCRPARMFSRELLPLPEGPSTAVMCPGSMMP
eukprot:3901118-Heterocapsa_arctica.AAC.1